ncbi:TadE/TadG family type IV pilus assembly protein [Taylorella equigenitalis]|uniref:Membrane protein n=3 Tax=Taylorella equigenitalis TaxID=29575 RepID=A0ABN4AV16_9BURK|nr:TadE family protein [Taylorella equigenitalis]ADU92101.1 putative exported protein [Taylorella equigenitalis MCE9]AFN35662.1 putative membrane protein [Taylorella equigenitalis ATCC 35865]ASY30312.1 hypothetical protein B9Z30_02770 [Taylorella equigenitalis]ASY37615.1 hypothetical protein CA605_02695 [Taylorella equigenitalis]ASY39084.1 hypothetical protein CA604_02870 [Taylorella equigenitalis]
MKIFPLKGSSAVEFLIAVIPCLLLSLICFEFTRWYQYKQILNLALLETARQAMVENANPRVIIETFEAETLPLFISKSPIALQKKIFAQNKNLFGKSWVIGIESPTCDNFNTWYDGRLSRFNPTINNSYQKEQADDKKDSSIFNANTIELSLIYPYKPIVPGVQFLIKNLLGSSWSFSYKSRIFTEGYIPIKTHVRISMHSNPQRWILFGYENVLYSKTC